MEWIVLGEKNGTIELVSKSNVTGMLPKGSFLTTESPKCKYILRVDESIQLQPYTVSPLVIEMDIDPILQDQKCQNKVCAHRVKTIISDGPNTTGLVEFLHPQSVARRSTQDEVHQALNCNKDGPKVFMGTIQSGENTLLSDNEGQSIYINLPIDMFYHQMLICGRTGSGKTVAAKYLMQYFVEELQGCVLAVNVKDQDLLYLDKPTKTTNHKILSEWQRLGASAHGTNNFMVYYPAQCDIVRTKKVSADHASPITLDVKAIAPEDLIGLLQNISDIAAQNLPNIFRYWQKLKIQSAEEFTFSQFVNYFQKGKEDKYCYKTCNTRLEEGSITLAAGTYNNVLRSLDPAIPFFDNKNAKSLDASDILQPGKLSVIDVAVPNGFQFGSVLLRNLLHKVVSGKSNGEFDVPVLIFIDEVHSFYRSDASQDALGDLDTICRTGRSQKIGVIFASQNPSDLPRGISPVINTKLFFRSDAGIVRQHGISIGSDEMESLEKGYAVCSIHDMSQVKIIKFPLAYSSVHIGGL